MSVRYRVEFGHPRLGEPKHFAGLTESQLVKTILEQGMHRVLSIQHDDPSARNIRRVEGREVVAIWKSVYKIIQKRKSTARPGFYQKQRVEMSGLQAFGDPPG
jgi:hypothetical protein